MVNWLDLHKKLMQEILTQEHLFSNEARIFAMRFIDLLRRSHYRLTVHSDEALQRYLESRIAAIGNAIEQAISIVGNATLTGMARDAFVAEQARTAFTRRWADGTNLSQRLWRWSAQTRRDIEQALADGVRLGTSVNDVVMQMQRVAEATREERFAIVSRERVRWVDDLLDAGRAVIRTPAMRQQWLKTLDKTKRYIAKLSEEGTAHGARQLISQVERAVEEGRTDLLDSGLRWRIYDKQQYHWKRIARTEMSNAHHQAVIASTRNNPAIIGYQWRLSGSHARKESSPDECDLYSNVEYGLGCGVFPAMSVPQRKPHPQCLCVLIPRVSPERERGIVSPYALPLLM